MDYIDYTGFMKRSWENDHKSHQDRLKTIIAHPSTRIDNKQSVFCKNAPCKKKPKKLNRDKLSEDQNLVRYLKDIIQRDIKKEIQERIDSVKTLKTLPKKFKPFQTNPSLIHENILIKNKLNTVKSNFSRKSWDQAFKSSKAYSKIRSKPHINSKIPYATAESPLSKRTLIDSSSLSPNLLYF